MNDYIEGHRAMSDIEGDGQFENTLTARCTCGWQRFGCKNRDEAVEALMKHGYEVGYAAAVGESDA